MTKPSAMRWASLLIVTAALTTLASPLEARPTRTSQAAKQSDSKAEPTADAPDEPPPIPVVGHLGWEGNENISQSQLEAVVFTHSRGWRVWRAEPEFSEPTLVGDMSRIEALYRQYGFYEARAAYSLVWNTERTSVAITVEIVEGPDVTLTSFDLVIPDDIDVPPEQLASLRAGLPLMVGERFSADRYARAKQTLLDRLADAAHPRARIEGGATVDIEDHVADVTWRVDPGPTVFFGEVNVKGLYRVDEKTAWREVHIVPGERYSTRALQRTRRAMQQQGLYSWVAVQSRPAPAPAEPSEAGIGAMSEPAPTPIDVPAKEGWAYEIWPVDIRVTERSPYTLDAGVGYSSDESFRASVGWRNGNFLGDARKLRFEALYSGILSRLQGEFIQPYFIDPKLSLISRAALRHETEPAFTADRVLTSLGVSRPLSRFWRGRVTYDFSWQDVTYLAPQPLIFFNEPPGTSKVASIEFGVRRQTLDDLLTPSRGTWLDLIVSPALTELGSDFDFVALLAEGRAFLPTPLDGVFASRLRIGVLQPIRGTTADEIPVVARFYTGGSITHRGFTYHRMPAVGTLNDNLGGTSLIESTLEWRVPIWGKIGAVAFVDAGLLDLQPFTFPLGSLFWAVGPGLRYDTVVGPIRFDYGVLLNPPPGFTRHRWFISVGNTF